MWIEKISNFMNISPLFSLLDVITVNNIIERNEALKPSSNIPSEFQQELGLIQDYFESNLDAESLSIQAYNTLLEEANLPMEEIGQVLVSGEEQSNSSLTDEDKQEILAMLEAQARANGEPFDESQINFDNVVVRSTDVSQFKLEPADQSVQRAQQEIPTFLERDDGIINGEDWSELFGEASLDAPFISLKPEFAWLAESDAFRDKSFIGIRCYRLISNPETNTFEGRGFDMSGFDFTGSTFRSSTDRGAFFSYANLQGANFSNADLADARFSDAMLKGIITNDETNLDRANFRDVNFYNYHDSQGNYVGYTTAAEYLASRAISPDEINPEELEAEYQMLTGFYEDNEQYPEYTLFDWVRSEYNLRRENGESEYEAGKVFDFMMPLKSTLLGDDIDAYLELEFAIRDNLVLEWGHNPLSIYAGNLPLNGTPYPHDLDPSMRTLIARKIASSLYTTDSARLEQIIKVIEDYGDGTTFNDGSPGLKMYLSYAKSGDGPVMVLYPRYTGINNEIGSSFGIDADVPDIIINTQGALPASMLNPIDNFSIIPYAVAGLLADGANSNHRAVYDNYAQGMEGSNDTVGEAIRAELETIEAWYESEETSDRQKYLLRQSFITTSLGSLPTRLQIGRLVSVLHEDRSRLENPHPELDPEMKEAIANLLQLLGNYVNSNGSDELPRVESTFTQQLYLPLISN